MKYFEVAVHPVRIMLYNAFRKIQQQVQSFTPHCQEISNGAQPISMVDGRDDEKIKTQYDAPTQTEKTASKTAGTIVCLTLKQLC